MISAIWGVKGGVGTTSCVIGMAAYLAREGKRSVIVDLAGDVPVALGTRSPHQVGFSDWTQRADELGSSLENIVVDLSPTISSIPRGETNIELFDPKFVESVLNDFDEILFDVGTDARIANWFSQHVVLAVVRNCYLSMHRLIHSNVALAGLVLINEPSRALNAADIAGPIQTPIVITIPCDAAIARAVDAGVLHSRPPRALTKSIAAADWMGINA